MVTREETAQAGIGARRSPLGRVLAQQAAIAEMAQRALEERNLATLLDEICVLASRVLETEMVDVLELAPDRRSLRVVAGIGWRPGVVGGLTVPAATGSQSGYTLATGGPVIAHDLPNERRFSVPETLQEHGVVAGITVRIGSADEPYGVLAAFTAHSRDFSHDDARFLQSMANVLGSAVAGLRADAELRRSRDEMATIVANVTDGITVQAPDGRLLFANDAAARLTGFASADEFVAAPLEQVMARFELLDEQGCAMPADRLPSRVALTTGQPSPPTTVRFRVCATGEERWSLVQAAPVRDAEGRLVQVINVFRDVTAQRNAENAQAMLAEVTGVLSGTLALGEAAHRLAELCAPRLADYCMVDLVEPDGMVREAAIAHADPERVANAHRRRERRPLRLDDPFGPGRVIREGTPEMGELNEDVLRAAVDGEEELRAVLELGVRHYLSVPLHARGRTIGALTMIHADSGRRFTEHELRVAEEIGLRAGVALENAQLYESVNERRAELETVIGAMAEAVLLFDERGELRLGNRAAERLFAGTPPALLDELRRRLAPADENGADETQKRAAVGDAEEAVGLGPDTPLEGERRLLGSGRWLEISVYRPRPGGAARRSARSSVVVLRDVTEARAAQVAREAFIGVLSHELRTPITTIFGGSELLERGLGDAEQSEIIGDIRAEAERLARLVEDLLVMSRVERGGVELGDEPVLLQRVLPPLVDSLKSLWPTLRVELNLAEQLPAVRGDVTYLEQLLRNVLTNAVRYGEALTTGVELTASADDGQVTVRVLDRGPGPGTEDPERLFEIFYRAPVARTVPGGAGIGLFVCRQLVEAMGGRMWARARDGGGSEFGFELPVIEGDAYV